MYVRACRPIDIRDWKAYPNRGGSDARLISGCRRVLKSVLLTAWCQQLVIRRFESLIRSTRGQLARPCCQSLGRLCRHGVLQPLPVEHRAREAAVGLERVVGNDPGQLEADALV